ncbi:monovalent cation/H(+) antiporter subunit G [Saccharomonospora sp.]|uniref:cation:proton antiporter n=1 Tax=Saccharomonospora sp. TaxID=33913 RepID=UPI0026288FA2|nr:monovalent cation/H(+) antiporter subunit G [Saccharomonospora sp.]
MISILLEILGSALLLIGLTLQTVSLYGVLRLPNTYQQLHAQGLATGPGVIAVLAAAVATENIEIMAFAVLTIAFVTITSPISSHAIARSEHHRQRRRQRHADRDERP